MAVLTTWLGLHFGLVVTHRKNHSYRLKHWTALSTVFFALGWVISPFWGMNKQVPSHTTLRAALILLQHFPSSSLRLLNLTADADLLLVRAWLAVLPAALHVVLAVVALVSLLHGGLVRLPADRDVHHLRLPAVPEAWDLCTCAALAGTRYDTTMRVELIGHFQPCMTDIYLPI